MDACLEDLRAAFREEAGELLNDLEGALLALETEPGDVELIGRVFRVLHTIKGNARMFGYEDLEGFVHEMETLFDLVRGGRLRFTGELGDLTLVARDLIRTRLGSDSAVPEAERSRLTGAVRALVAAARGDAPGEVPAPPREEAKVREWCIRFRPASFGALDGQGGLFQKLSMLGDCRVTLDASGLPALDSLDADVTQFVWQFDLRTDCDEETIRGSFPAGDEAGELTMECRQATGAAEGRVGRVTTRQGEAESSIRVSAGRLDLLMNLVGELITVQARLDRVAAAHGDPELQAVAGEVARLGGGLRDTAFAVRMVPIGTLFGPYRRLVRDLARDTGKEIDLVTEGGETELDKSVIERLGEPVVHLLRNSVDHGIEPPELRAAAGKPARGVIRLSANQAGADVLITIADDGGGLDAAAIRATAVRRGILPPGVDPGEEVLLQLIFTAGFSTAETVSSISGRGVGLDVVKRTIEGLQGTLEVRSRAGQGTEFTLRLPLTLAIVQGLETAVGGERFILPVALVEECVEWRASDGSGERRLAEVRGELIPFIRLREWFSVPGGIPEREQIVITRARGTRVGIAVDDLVGEHQTVIKPLGRVFADHPGFSGATILGDGSVALILDVPGLIGEFEEGAGRSGATPGSRAMAGKLEGGERR